MVAGFLSGFATIFPFTYIFAKYYGRTETGNNVDTQEQYGYDSDNNKDSDYDQEEVTLDVNEPLDYEVLQAYIHDTKDVLLCWKETKEELAILSKIYEENKNSVDTLRKNNTTYDLDEFADGIEVSLEPIEVLLQAELRKLKKLKGEFDEIDNAMNRRKRECREIMESVRSMYQEIMIASSPGCEGQQNDAFLGHIDEVVFAKTGSPSIDDHYREHVSLQEQETSKEPPSTPSASNAHMDPDHEFAVMC